MGPYTAATSGFQQGYGFADAIIDTGRRRAREDTEDRLRKAQVDDQLAQRDFERQNREAGQQAFAKMNVGVDGAQPATREQAMLTVAEAQADHALKAGRMDSFVQHFGQAAQMRAQMRQQAFDDADRQYAATGDYNVYLKPLSLWKNGVDTTSIKPADTVKKDDQGNNLPVPPAGARTFKITNKMDGQDYSRDVDEGTLKQFINYARNPQAAIAAEIERAKEEQKSRLKMGEKTHDTNEDIRKNLATYANDPKERFRNVGKADSVVDLQRGAIVAQGADAGMAGAPRGGLVKEQLPVFKDIEEHARGNFGGELLPGMTQRPHSELSTRLTQVGQAVYLGSQQAGLDINPALAVQIAKDGKAGTATIQLPDGSTYKGPAIQYQGRTYPLGDPQGMAAQPGPARAPAGAPAAAATPGQVVARGVDQAAMARVNGDPTVVASNAQAPQRASDRMRILQDERAALMASKAPPEQIAGIEREISRAQAEQGTQPAAVPVAQPAAPAPVNLRAVENRMQPLAPRDAAGMQLDAARRQLSAAQEEIMKWGQRQRAANPAGFAKVQRDYQLAKAAVEKADAQYQATFTAADRAAFGRPTAGSVVAGQ